MTIKGMALACLAMLASGWVVAFDAVDIGTYFPDVVQGHHGNNNDICHQINSPQFKQYNSSRINGTLGRDLKFCGINSTYERPATGCDTALGGNRYCSDTNYDIRGLKVDGYNYFLGSSGAAGSIWSCSNGDTLSLGSNGNQYGTVQLYARCTVSVSARYSEYRFNTLELGNSARLVLTQGDYWVDRLSITDGGELILQGDARLFINKNAVISSGLMNMDGKRSLLLVAYGDLTMTGNSQINGYVYSDNKLAMNNNSLINGRVTSRYLFMEGQSQINKKDYVGDSLDHYELYYPSQSLTCEGASIQLLACQNNNCSQRYVNGAQVALSPASGWSSNPVTIGSSGLAALTLSRLTSGNVTLGLTSSAPSAPLRCYRDGVLDNSCSMSFTDAALRFDFSTFYAGDTASTTIRAIRSNDAGATRVCVPLLTGNQTLQFGHAKLVSEPTSSSVPSINDSALTPTGSVSVLFDGNGVGQLALKYPDAGVLRLDATFQKSDTTGTLRLTGSDTVAVLPSAILLRGQDQPVCSGSDDASYMGSCGVYRKAGETYTLLAQAINRQGVTTAGFGATNLPLQWATLAPSSGVSGTPSPTSLSVANGMSLTAAQWDEVGVLKAGVSNFIPYPGYQTESPQLEVPLRWSGPIGRFVPWDFNLVSGAVTPACGDFSYMSQPFDVQTTVQARNKEGSVTKNYRDAFARGALTLVVANNQDGVDRANRLDPLVTSWSAGVADFTGQSRFMRLRELTPGLSAPEEPLRRLQFGLRVADGETPETSFLADRDMNPAVTGTCQSGVNCTAKRLDVPQGTDDTMIAYYGRLLASTRQGVASAPLALPLQVQYFEGGRWKVNQADVCTQLSLANEGFDPATSLDPTRKISFNNGSYEATGQVPGATPQQSFRSTLTLSGLAAPASVATANKGEILFHFSAPVPVPNKAFGIPYKVELSKQPSRPLWLADPATADHLLGEAIFGRDRGNDRIIYRREVMP
ncbi:DUF6701 domain-containing protein [Aeromonas taiwanensis]|uniref:DUF6701 domain-containing protein n=1 Tax=Aeromonas taiwanensis TaxID=633417 RepID=UPI003BA2B4B1